MTDLYVDLRYSDYTHSDLRKHPSRPGPEGAEFMNGLIAGGAFALMGEPAHSENGRIVHVNCGYAGCG